MSEILSGPYGSELEDRERREGPRGLSDPTNIFDGVGHAEAVADLAARYRRAGATTILANTFRLRALLHRIDAGPFFDSAVEGHIAAVREACGEAHPPILSFGPARDCYSPELAPSRSEARDFHDRAYAAAARTGSVAWVETLNTIEEAVGAARAASARNVPTVIGFVLGRDGTILSGESLADAVAAVDDAVVSRPFGYVVNCSPIEIIDQAIAGAQPKHARRIIGAYSNASSLPPQLLDCRSLTSGVVGLVDSAGVARHLAYIGEKNQLRFIGGCCGHNPASIRLIARAVAAGDYQCKLPRTDYPLQ